MSPFFRLRWAWLVLWLWSCWMLPSFLWSLYETRLNQQVHTSLPFAYTEATSAPSPQASPWPWFGLRSSGDAPEPLGEVVSEPRPTALNLTLMGVVVDSAGLDSGAIIGRDGRSEYFRINDMIQANVFLRGVFSDRVVISRSGNSESLYFPETPMNADSNQPAGNAVGQFVSGLSEQLQRNPEAALGRFGLQPRGAVGDSQGYIYTGGQPLLEQAGLQAGDIILAVNGAPLGNIEQDRVKLQQWLPAQSPLQIEVQRKGTVVTIGYAIPER